MGFSEIEIAGTSWSGIVRMDRGGTSKETDEVIGSFFIGDLPYQNAMIVKESLLDTHPFNGVQHIRDMSSGGTL